MGDYAGDFALVCEGITDYAVVKNVLIGIFQGQASRKPVINQAQPDLAPGAEEWQKFGGWQQVIRYLDRKLYRKAFQTNAYVVVHIDTDISAECGLAPLPGDLPMSVQTFIAYLQNKIGNEDLRTYRDRFLFAVCVDQIECWILPLWFKDARARKVTGCIGALASCPQLRDVLSAKNLPWIRPEEKNPQSYDEASRDYRKRATLLGRGSENPSLNEFLKQVELRKIRLEDDE